MIHIKAVMSAIEGTGRWGELLTAEETVSAATAEFVAASHAEDTARADLEEIADDDSEDKEHVENANEALF